MFPIYHNVKLWNEIVWIAVTLAAVFCLQARRRSTSPSSDAASSMWSCWWRREQMSMLKPGDASSSPKMRAATSTLVKQLFCHQEAYVVLLCFHSCNTSFWLSSLFFIFAIMCCSCNFAVSFLGLPRPILGTWFLIHVCVLNYFPKLLAVLKCESMESFFLRCRGLRWKMKVTSESHPLFMLNVADFGRRNVDRILQHPPKCFWSMVREFAT